jgi:hypothetical protein
MGNLAATPDRISDRVARIPCRPEAEVTGPDSEAVLAPRAPSGEADAGGATRASGRITSDPLNDTADSATGAASAEDATAVRAGASVSAGS